MKSVLVTLIAFASTAIAQVSLPDLAQQAQADRKPRLIPPLLPAVTQRIAAPFNTEEERTALRIEHGQWTEDDLDTPARRARAALIARALDHPDLFNEEADALDRAEAALLRGDLDDAIELANDSTSLRAIRIRAQAYFDLGEFDKADDAIDPAVERLARVNLDDADEMAEGVRALQLRANIRGPERVGGGDYETLLSLLRRAREQIDRLSWQVRLAEAELLYDKHNGREATAAATEALRLNPRAAAALALVGRIAVDGFNMDAAEYAATLLDELAESVGGANPAGPMVRARARLRQSDAEGAELALRDTLDFFPRHRGVLALDAAAAAASFDDDELAEDLERFDELSPDSPLALFEVGAALSEARQYEPAQDYLNLAISRLPNWPAPLIELGLVSVQSGDDLAAIEALSSAAELDRWDIRAQNSLKLVQRLQEYETIESEHFVVRYKPGIDALLAVEMVPVLEEIHARIASSPAREYLGLPGGVGHEPEQKTLIELLPDHSEFAVRITGMPAIHTIAASTGPVIAMETPREGRDHPNGTYDWPRVVQHEYVHTVTLSRTKNRIPHWFTEASAVFYEDAPRDENRWRLLTRVFQSDELFDLDGINVGFVRPKKPTDRAQAYAQGHWMYQYMAERWGPEAPVDLMDKYAVGIREEQAFNDVLGIGRDEFLKDFTAWAESDLRSVGMLPPEGYPSITELLEEETEGLSDEQKAQFRPDEIWAAEKLSEYPDHPDLMELLVIRTVGQREGGLTEPDVRLLEEYAEVRPVSDLPHRRLALHYLASEDLETRVNAIEHLEFLDAREQSTAAFASALVRLYADTARWDEAAVAAERAVRIDPFDAETRELAARVALVKNDPATAERHIRALTKIEPDRRIHEQRLEAVSGMKVGMGSE
ncbi:MAG: hypothetical protein AAGI17_09170 [Planctomycetota bacterium]